MLRMDTCWLFPLLGRMRWKESQPKESSTGKRCIGQIKNKSKLESIPFAHAPRYFGEMTCDSFENTEMELFMSWPTWRASLHCQLFSLSILHLNCQSSGLEKKTSHVHPGEDEVQVSHEIPTLLNSQTCHLFSWKMLFTTFYGLL